jgi:preprotein translocase subunit SecD
MNFYARRFNLYLLVFCVALAAGCALQKKKKPEKVAGIRVHVESPVTPPGKIRTITVLRSQPVEVNVTEDPALTEANLVGAKLIESPGGFAVSVQFDETGGWMLEQATAGNPGKHLAIYGQWGETVGEGRWLAAPLISRRIGGGSLTFTPDASREEAEKFVEGLNNTVKLIHTGPEK